MKVFLNSIDITAITICGLNCSEKNLAGGLQKDEPIFATKEVSYHGQVIAGIVCTNIEAGEKALPQVEVNYDGDSLMDNVILGVRKAELNSLHSFWGPQRMTRIQKPKEIDSSKHKTISGSVHVGGQEHFYMEPSNCLVVPCKEKEEYTLYISAQGTDSFQGMLSDFLEVPRHKVTVNVKRAGGGFGGKQSGRSTAKSETKVDRGRGKE